MKSRSQWQNDVDDACAEAMAAGSEYGEAIRELREAQLEVEHANMAMATAETDLNSSQQQFSNASSALSQSQRGLSGAVQRLSHAERAVSNAQGKVDRSKVWLEELMELVRTGRSRSEGVNILDGPTRFVDHFEVARETWTSERIFFTNLIEQLEGSLGSLTSAVEKANRPRTSTGFGGSLIDSLSALGFGGGGTLAGFDMPFLGRVGHGFLPSIGAGALPGMSPVPFGGGISTSCALCTSPFNLRTPVSFPSFITPPLTSGPPGLNTQPLPYHSTPTLGTTASFPPLSLGTSDLTPALGSSLSAVPPPPALGTAGTNLGGLSMDLPYSSEWSTPMMASGGGANFEIAPLVSSWEGQSGDMGGVFKGAGHSHFTFAPDDGGWHVTTEVPGIPGGYSERLDISDFGGGFAMDGAGFGGFDGGYDAGFGGSDGGCGFCS